MEDTTYGHYDDARREYVITRWDTPWPWINYLGCGDFFGLVSNTGGGYCFCRDAKFRRLTRYRYNSVPIDNVGRYFYINDGGTLWSPGCKPCLTPLDSYECRHGMGYTRITGAKDGLEASALMLVPLGARCEVHRLTLRNTGGEAKSVGLFSYAEWCLWNASTDGENFQRNLSTGEVEIEGSVIYHKTEYKERRDHYAFYSVNAAIDGFDTDRESFVGLYNGLDAPQVVAAGRAAGSMAHGWSPIASHYINVTLGPGEARDFVFVLGYVENEQDEKFSSGERGCEEFFAQSTPTCPIINKAKAKAMIAAYDTAAKVDAAMAELRAYWDDLLGRFVVKTPEPRLDRMVNVWNQYQCMVTFCMSRSASFFESGIGRGMGFRDSNQDLVGFVHQIPSRARERIIDIASTQFPDGGCYHQYQPLTKRGNNEIGGGFNDDPLWLIFGTAAYVKETGDFGILREPAPFDNRPGSEVPLMEHLRVSLNHVVNNLGPHGLPLIGRADWNDCLNLNCFSWNPDESFQTTENRSDGSRAESLMIAGLMVVAGRDYAELCRQTGDDDEAGRAEALVEAMTEAVKRHGWDGEWFLRAYDFYGRKVGSRENQEGQIFIESQGWCAMAAIGLEEGMVERALNSVKDRLDCRHGIVLNNPAFTRYHAEYGEISTYPAGYKENAGIFCHNNPWVIIGETVLGRGDRAWEYFSKICPTFINDQALHKVEPYVYSQMIAGKDAARPGEAKNSWLTGTAAWNYYAITQFILGVKPAYSGLEINPCIPSGWREYTVVRRFRGAEYHVTVKNPFGVCRGVASLLLDGQPLAGTIVPYSPGVHTVEVTLGQIPKM